MRLPLKFYYHKLLSGLSKSEWKEVDMLIQKEVEGDCNDFVFALHRLLPPQNQTGLFKNKHLIKYCLSVKGAFLYCLPTEYQDNEDIVKIAMQQNLQAFRFASKRIRSKLSFINTAISKSYDTFECVEGDCLKNKSTVLQLAGLHPAIALSPLAQPWMNDKDFGMAVVKSKNHREANTLRFLSLSLIDDEDICRVALKRRWTNFEHCSDRLKRNYENTIFNKDNIITDEIQRRKIRSIQQDIKLSANKNWSHNCNITKENKEDIKF